MKLQAAISIIEVPPSITDPLGITTHLIRLAFRDKPANPSMMSMVRSPIYLTYQNGENAVSVITEDEAARIAIIAAFKDAEISRPIDSEGSPKP